MSDVRLWKRLKELREHRQLTQLQLAEKLNIGRASVSNYENGDRVPDADVVIKFADFFNVSTDYLLGRSEFKNFGQEYDFFRNRLGLGPQGPYSAFVNPNNKTSVNLFELNDLMVSVDENYSSIITEIITGNEKFRIFALTALEQLFNMIVYTGEILKANEYDQDMEEYLDFLLKLKNMPISPSDFGHFQANQTQIKACTRFFNEFITLFVYVITDLEKQNLHTEV